MARNKPLLSLLQDLRLETRASGNPAHNSAARDAQVAMLQRVQEDLWEETDWPFLRVERFLDLQAGQYLYDTPDDLPLERVEKIDVRYNDEWVPLDFGIGDSDFALYDSYVGERSWPVEKWRIHEDEMIEVWPVPSDNGARYDDENSASLEGRLRLTGIRKLDQLVYDDDRADLDDRMIVLHAAARILGGKGAPDAEVKARDAEKRRLAMTGNASKTRRFKVFGARGGEPRRRPQIPTIHYRDRQS